MATKRKGAAPAFVALTVEGSLIAPAMLVKIASQGAEGQKEADYAVPPGLTLREEISRYFRIGQALFKAFRASETPTEYATLKFIEALLTDVFGFADVTRVGQRELHGQTFALSLEALGGRTPVVVVPPSDPLDKASPHLAAEGRRRSAVSAIQDWLNASEGALWGLCTNGLTLRLVRDNESLTRPAYIEADLIRIFEDEAYADFALLWLLIHASRFGAPGTPATDCALERWREAGAKEGVAAREKLRGGFEDALLALGNGFLSDQYLRERLVSGALPLTDYFGQLLHLAYRLIFLFVAEDRDLLHPPSAPAIARRLYAEGYSVSALRERAVRRANWDAHQDRWQGLVIVFEALRQGEPNLSLPALGGLFGPLMMDDLMAASLPNRALMEAVFRLAWLRDGDVLMPVNWHDMETEELGSVYEGLLELTPRLGPEGRGFAFAEGAETKGNSRKTSGSYYTPDSLVQALLDSSLDLVLDQVEAEGDNPAEALLSVSVIDPACGSGHFLLGALRRIATRVARARAAGVASAEEYRHALRDVARRCIHGVDRNPMAVELTKVALWIETVEPGKPLGFLDANIRCGDALLGVFDLEVLKQGIPDEAYKPLTGDDKAAASMLKRTNKAEREHVGNFAAGYTGADLARAAERVLAMPEDEVEEIDKKRAAYEGLRRGKSAGGAWLAADLYVAAFLRPKRFGAVGMAQAKVPDRVPTTADLRTALTGRIAHPETVAAAMEAARDARAFHWPLEFPAVMAKGGFDCVLGNPPWEVMQLGEEEYFAQRLPEIADLAGATRKRAIAALEVERPEVFSQYQSDKRTFEASNEFARASGRFELTARGKVNTYALFAELFAQALSRRGRAGVIVPTGLITDYTTSAFFASLVASQRLGSAIAFDNQKRVFPSIHPDTPFALLTIGRTTGHPEFAAYLLEEAHLAEPERRFRLSPEEIAAINPNTKTAPIFRSRADAALSAKIYSHVPVFVDYSKGTRGNPWHVEFHQGLFNMTSDSALFHTAAQLAEAGFSREGTDWVGSAGRYIPLYEAKMVHQFDHRWASYEGTDSRDVTVALKASPDFEPAPRYWVPEREVNDSLAAKGWSRGWLMGWRDITNATNERTVISTAFPRVGVNHKVPLVFVEHPPTLAAALLGNLSALVLDYVARQKVGGTSLTYFYLKQFPVLPPSAYSPADLSFVTPRVLKLTYTSYSMAPFAGDLGCFGPPFAWDEDRRALLRAELDAFYARKYGLTRDELRYILDPADVMGPDYPSETFRVLKKNEIAKYGEYRTARLVLQAWDRMERGELIT